MDLNAGQFQQRCIPGIASGNQDPVTTLNEIPGIAPR
jgi:hypothetical protein